MKLCKDSFLELIVTCFFIGKIKKAPGTCGSLAAFPFSYFIAITVLRSDFRIYIPNFTLYQTSFVTVFVALIVVIIMLFILGTICSSIYINKINKEDPQEIVIDELVGQMLVIVSSSLSVAFIHYAGIDQYIQQSILDFLFFFLVPFMLFRLFDIYKPYPIDWIDQNVKGGLGVMLDDVMAAIFAIVAQYAIVFIIIDIHHFWR